MVYSPSEVIGQQGKHMFHHEGHPGPSYDNNGSTMPEHSPVACCNLGGLDEGVSKSHVKFYIHNTKNVKKNTPVSHITFPKNMTLSSVDSHK